MKTPPAISEAEWHVMKLLWKKSPLTSHEMIDSLTCQNWSDSTIKTLLSRLIKKEAIAFEKKGKIYLYRPLITEKKSKTHLCSSFLDRIFGGSVTPLLQHFVEEHKLSADEVQQLQNLLNQKKK